MTIEQSLRNKLKRKNKEIRDLRSENNLLGLQKTEFENLYKQLKEENERLKKNQEKQDFEYDDDVDNN